MTKNFFVEFIRKSIDFSKTWWVDVISIKNNSQNAQPNFNLKWILPLLGFENKFWLTCYRHIFNSFFSYFLFNQSLRNSNKNLKFQQEDSQRSLKFDCISEWLRYPSLFQCHCLYKIASKLYSRLKHILCFLEHDYCSCHVFFTEF